MCRRRQLRHKSGVLLTLLAPRERAKTSIRDDGGESDSLAAALSSRTASRRVGHTGRRTRMTWA